MTKEEATPKMLKLLKAAGFAPGKTVGSHTKWVNGSVSVSVPDGHRTISPGVVRQIQKAIKEASK